MGWDFHEKRNQDLRVACFKLGEDTKQEIVQCIQDIGVGQQIKCKLYLLL